MSKKHPLSRRFISSDEAVTMKTQHRKPCADCPFARAAIPGWLGGSRHSGELATADEWIGIAHGEDIELCHCTTNQQCAGLAIFRANVCKLPRQALCLPADETLVFATDKEFADHHSKTYKP